MPTTIKIALLIYFWSEKPILIIRTIYSLLISYTLINHEFFLCIIFIQAFCEKLRNFCITLNNLFYPLFYLFLTLFTSLFQNF